MKKILMTMLFLVTAIVIVGCVPKKHKVEFYVDSELYKTQYILDKETIEKVDTPKKDGYTFEYWLEGEEKFEEDTIITKNIRLDAKFAKNEEYFNVKFLVDGEEFIVKQVIKGKKLEFVDGPERDGYQFEYWMNDNEKFSFETIISNDLVLVAKYTEVGHEVKYYIDNNVHRITRVSEGKILKLIDAPNKIGYKFLYWTVDGIKYDNSKPANNDITLTAKYERINNQEVTNMLDFYYINDTHGAVLNKENEMGVAKIANLIKSKKLENPDNTVFITGGDMFQGQLISNDNRGAVIVESLNSMNLDAFVIGNHEFDWGLETILKYFNPKTSGVKANFPILGANVKLKSTDEMPEFLDAYTIVNKGNIKVGIIGLMGDGLETSIAKQRVNDYYFSNVYQEAQKYVDIIKDQVDMIVVSVHGYTLGQGLMENLANLDKVHLIYNAHTHQKYYGEINRNDYQKVQYAQAGANGYYVSNINFKYKIENENIFVNSQTNEMLDQYNEQLLEAEDVEVKKIVDRYYNQVKHLYEEVVLIAGENMSRDVLANYISKVMKEKAGAVVGFQNSGGTRSELYRGQEITAADIFQIFPFDNRVIGFDVKGSELRKILKNQSLYASNDLLNINDNEIYRVTTNDYVFYSYSEFVDYTYKNEQDYGDMYEVLKKLKANGETHFSSESEILVNQKNPFFKGFFLFICYNYFR
ncbi:bifunctional metallophosphatase/5'-nucleotidase [Haploplasma axanthum]|nr:InlB B-repeat-containing protein [Haploplasma axanthum]